MANTWFRHCAGTAEGPRCCARVGQDAAAADTWSTAAPGDEGLPEAGAEAVEDGAGDDAASSEERCSSDHYAGVEDCAFMMRGGSARLP